jgi:hypothetical protein
MARRVLLIVALGLLGILAAASIGYASYLVSRDEVGLPVTKLEPAPTQLAPPPARTDTTRTATVEETGPIRTTSTGEDRTTTGTETEDNRGRGRGRGRSGGDSSGSGSSGSGSGGGSGSDSGSGGGGDD